MKSEFQLNDVWAKYADQPDSSYDLSPPELEMIGGGAVMTNDD